MVKLRDIALTASLFFLSVYVFGDSTKPKINSKQEIKKDFIIGIYIIKKKDKKITIPIRQTKIYDAGDCSDYSKDWGCVRKFSADYCVWYLDNNDNGKHDFEKEFLFPKSLGICYPSPGPFFELNPLTGLSEKLPIPKQKGT